MTKEQTTLPLDTRLLSDAIVELNISLHNVSVYPKNHPIVTKSLTRCYESIQHLFELRDSITLAVAKDILIVDDSYLDKANPIFKEFAQRLSRMNIAFVTFSKGIEENELYGFHQYLLSDIKNVSPEETEALLAEFNLSHITAGFVDYSAFNLVEEQVDQEENLVSLWEKFVYGLMEGKLKIPDASEIIHQIPAARLAYLLNRALPENMKEDSYDKVITAYVRGSSERALESGEIRKLTNVINGLNPELKKQFLASTVSAMSSDSAAVRKALSDMSTEEVFHFLDMVNENAVTIPDALKNVLDKFSTLDERLGEAVSYGGELIEDDILLSEEISTLMSQTDFDSFVSQNYQQEIQQLMAFDVRQSNKELLRGHENEWSDEYVDRVLHQTILEIISSPSPEIISTEDHDKLAEKISNQAVQFLQTGQYEQVLSTLNVLESNVKRQHLPDLCLKTLQTLHSAHVLASFVTSARIMGREMREEVMSLCEYYGEDISPHLVDALIQEGSSAVRRFLISLISQMGTRAIPETLKRLSDDRWFVKRNMLFILLECGDELALAQAEPYCKHGNPKVSFVALKCLLKIGNPRGISALRANLNSDSKDLADRAADLAGLYRVRAVVPDIIRKVEKKSLRGSDIEDKIPFVRALGQIGDPRAKQALEHLQGTKSLFFRKSIQKLQHEAGQALKNIAESPKEEEGRTDG